MVTRKARLISGFVTILMLISMFTCFVVPVSAEAAAGGIASATGLVNKADLTDIKDYDAAAVEAEYKVTDRAGMDMIATLVNGGTTLDNITIWQMADIDMGWTEFAGIGRDGKNFKGNFDGNGFTVDNLFIQLKQNGVGLFSWVSGAEIRNVGISGGITMGLGWTGGIVGCVMGSTTITNCWNAGTVIAGHSSSAGSGGVVGRMNGANIYVYNCYNLGLLVGLGYKMSGVAGWLNNTAAGVVNSYNAGEIVADMISNNAYDKTGDYEPWTLAAYTSVLCKNFTSAYGGATSNNYYITGRGKLGSVKELSAANPNLKLSSAVGNDPSAAIHAVTDDATGLEASAIDTMAAKLNSGASAPNAVGAVDGYYVSYENTDAGYPALTYRKTDASGEIVVQRVAKTTENVNGAKTWETASPLFAQLVACRLGALKADNSLLAELKVTNADDLWLLSLISFGNNFKSMIQTVNFAGKVVFTDDVDMSKRTIGMGVAMYPISRGVVFNGTIDGGDHVISNLSIDLPTSSTYPRVGLIYHAQNATVQNLGIASGTVRISGNYGGYEPYVGSFFGLADGSTTIRRCWNAATVACEVVKTSGSSNSSASGIGRMHNGTTMDNCYNLGLVKNVQCASASGLNDFGQNAAHLYNSFAYCDIQHTGKSAGNLIRQRTWSSGTNLPYQEGETWPHANTYAVGGSLKFNDTSGTTSHPAVEEESYWLGAAAYSSGELAWTLNDGYVNGYNAGSGTRPFYTVDGGKTVFGTAVNQTRRVVLQKKYGDALIEETYVYVNAGASYTYPEIEGYTVSGMPKGYDAANQSFTMPQTDVTLVYAGTEAAAAKTVVDLYAQYEEGYKAAFDLFVAEQQTKLNAAYTAAKEIAGGTAADPAASMATVIANYIAPADLEMKNEYPYYPKASQVADYISIYDKDASGRLNYRVSTVADWIYLTEEGLNAAEIMDSYPQYENTRIKGGYADDNAKVTTDGDYVVILNVTNDIEFDGEVMAPAKLDTNITLNGRGKVFKNIAVEKAVTGAAAVGLLERPWNIVIQNLGIEGGYVKATGTAKDSEAVYVSSFSGLNEGGYNRLYNCWSTADVINEVPGATAANRVAAGLANWKNPGSHATNCYYAGELESTGIAVLVNYFGTSKTNNNKNTYGVGEVTFSNSSTAAADQAYILAADAAATGELAWTLNSGYQTPDFNSKYAVERQYHNVNGSVTAYGKTDGTDQSRKITAEKTLLSGLTDELFYYANAGATTAAPAIPNYTLDATRLPEGITDATSFAMPNSDITFYYTQNENPASVDFSTVKAIVNELKNYEVGHYETPFDLFTDGADIKAAYDLAVEAVALEKEEMAEAELQAAFAAVTAAEQAYAKVDGIALKNAYPYYPAYSAYAVYSELNTAKNWAIGERADWEAFVAAANGGNSFSGITFHLTGNIEMGGEANPIEPAYYTGTSFAGTLNGHDHVFKNLWIDHDVSKGVNVGLIGGMASGGYILNLGIESGRVRSYGQNSDETMHGAIVGIGWGKIQKCWNGAEVLCEVTSRASVSGIGRFPQGNTLMDGCYNIGKVHSASSTSSQVSGLNDWPRDNHKMYNSFSLSDITDKNGNVTQMMRHRSPEFQNLTSIPLSNNYAVGGMKYTDQTNAGFDPAPYLLDADAYTTGELAWKLNTGYEKGTRVYYKLVDSKTVFAADDGSDQTRRITVKMGDYPVRYYYASAGETITLDYTTDATYALGSAVEGYAIDGDQLTVGNGDIEVLADGFYYAEIEAQLEYYKDKVAKPAYFANAAGDDVAAVYAAVLERYHNRAAAYETQADIDADAALLAAFEYAGYPDLPAAQEKELFPDAPGYLVSNLADLEYVAVKAGDFTAEQTLHITAEEIAVTEGSAANSLAGLKASIDGHGATVKGVSFEGGNGWLGNYAGYSVKNLVLDGWNATELDWGSGLLIGVSYDVDLVLDNITVKNSKATSKVDTNYHSLLIGFKSNGSLAITNIAVEDSEMAFVHGGTETGTGNAGLVLGRFMGEGDLLIDGVQLTGNTLSGKNHQTAGTTGILAGEIEATAGTVTFKNIGVVGTTVGEDIVLSGIVVARAKTGTANISNAIVLVDESITAPIANLNPVGTADVAAENVYTNAANLVGGTKTVAGANTTAEEVASGKITGALNAIEGAATWALTADGVPYLATGGVTHTVHFGLADKEYEADAALDVTLYTDDQGMLIGLTEALKQTILDAAAWSEDTVAEWSGRIEEDKSYEGIPYPKHDDSHTTAPVPSTDGINHTVACTAAVDGVACRYELEAPCLYTAVCVDKSAEPEDAQHQELCACGYKKETVDCTMGEPNTVEPTLAAPGSVTTKCTLCDYQHVALIPALMGLVMDEAEGYCGDEMVVNIGLQNNRGLGGATFKMTYNGNDLTLDKIELALTGTHAEVPVQIGNTETDPETGMVTVKFNFLTNQNYTGFDLLKLTFTVAEDAAEGVGTLAIDVVDAADFEGAIIAFEDLTGSYELFDRIPGDATGDKEITIKDAVMLMRLINEDEAVNAYNPDLENADVNADGEIDVRDVIPVLQYLNGSISLDALYAAGEN